MHEYQQDQPTQQPIALRECRSFLEQARDSISLGQYSIRTEEPYLRWMKQYILFHNKRHPSLVGDPEVTSFLSHLAVDRKVAGSIHTRRWGNSLPIHILYKDVHRQPLED